MTTDYPTPVAKCPDGYVFETVSGTGGMGLAGSMIHAYPTRDAWLAARSDRIGASEVHPLLNDPALFLQRREVPTEDNDDLWRGRELEPYIGKVYARQTGNPADPPWKHYDAPEGTIIVETLDSAPWAACTIDFYSGSVGVVETKSQRSRAGWASVDEQIQSVADLAESTAPPHMACQAYWQLLVTGRMWCDLCALLPSYELRIIRFHRDEAFQAELLACVGEARERYLVRKEIPPPSASPDYTALLARRFPQVGKTVRRATAIETALLSRYADARARAEAAESEAAVLRAQVLRCIGADYGIAGGGYRAIAPTIQRESLKLSEIPDDLRIELDRRGLIRQGAGSRQLRLS
jgi:hypothetical protein